MSGLMQSRWLRAVMAGVLCVPLLAGCADSGANDPNLTPEQRRIRAQRAEQDRTVGGGAIAGAVVGGLLGALLGGNNRGGAAAIGAVAGAAVGGAGGYYVAKRKQRYANENERLDSMAADVRVDNQQMAQYVADHQPGKRRERPDRERAKAIKQPFAEIGRKAHARIDGVERHRLHQDAGQKILQIGAD